MSNYGFSLSMQGDFEQIVDKVFAALKTEGFGVLTDIDVKKTLKEKLGADMLAYRILGACNPPLAHKAITAEPDIGLLLPCNVVVRSERNGEVIVAFMDPLPVLAMVDKPEITALGQEVRMRLQRVKELLARE